VAAVLGQPQPLLFAWKPLDVDRPSCAWNGGILQFHNRIFGLGEGPECNKSIAGIRSVFFHHHDIQDSVIIFKKGLDLFFFPFIREVPDKEYELNGSRLHIPLAVIF
jgi:hypothetical protein